MSWIDEQIKYRIQKDDEEFQDAIDEVSAAVTRKKRISLTDERAKIKNSVDEILRYYHMNSQELPADLQTPEEQIEFLCRPNGIMHREVRLTKGWYKDSTGVLLGKRKEGGVVALLPGKWGGYVYFDEASNKKKKLNRETETIFEEEAICFYRPFPARKLSVFDLLNYIRRCSSPVVIAETVILMLAVTAIGLLTPLITQLVFSEVLESKSLTILLSVAILSISVEISRLLLNGVQSLLMSKINTNMEVSVQAATMARILSLPADFFKQFSSGEITSRAEYINEACTTLVSVILSTSLTSLFSLVYIFQVFAFAPALALPALIITLATFIFSTITTMMQMKITKKEMEYSASLSGMTYSMITGIQKIKVSGSEKRMFTRWLRHYTKEAKLAYNPPALLRMSGIVTTGISLFGTILLYECAITSHLSVSDYYAFTSAYGMVTGAFASLTGIEMLAAAIKPTIQMAKPIMDAEPEGCAGRKIISKLSGSVELNNVTFRYSKNMPYVIDNLSLKIRPGQYIALVGKTGCGKSTLVRLLLGFETPSKGAIYYDGKDMQFLDLKSLRKNIGVVMQNGKLFLGDIYSNIAISSPGLPLEDAWKAAETVGIAEDIRKMPMGMRTVITEGSGSISGGQKQRLLLARAIAAKPKILILDEATSALDNLTQKQVSEALDQLRCTRIVIAHRLSTIQQCDRIIVLEDGKISEDGTYEELIQLNGQFADLIARQRLEN